MQSFQYIQIVNLVDCKAFVQCCHGKHTVASSRTLLLYHVKNRKYDATAATLNVRLGSESPCFHRDISSNNHVEQVLYPGGWLVHWDCQVPYQTDD